MYCVRGNYEFGITRVMDSLRPYDKKLGPDTWYYTKRCFLALIENLAKQLLLLKDSVLRDCIHFLEDCESQYQSLLLARDSIYAIERYMSSPVRPSVCLSVCYTGGSVKDG